MREDFRNTILLLSIEQLKGKTFSIGNYQRGYKWGKKEILELLNDINSYEKANGIYCLQPLILKPLDKRIEKIETENNTYEIYTNNEVIDGQQRSTTLYILLKYLVHLNLIDESNLFQINYTTRERSGTFLKENLNLIFDWNIDSILDKELIEKHYSDLAVVNNLWEAFTKQHKEFDNVDVYHFFSVTCYLKKWIALTLTNDEEQKEFINQFLHRVKVIWYSLDDAIDNNNVIEVFLNNNKGKISLTTSELIKALFILNIRNNEVQSLSELQINQFALEWDQIEKKLQDDNFWYFIQPNGNVYNDGTRIDYLFDLLIKKGPKEDKFYAYRYYETLFNQGNNLTSDWEKLVQLYTKLVDWYNDSKIYHFLGFITVSKIKHLSKIILESKGKTKEQLKNYLIGLIQQEFARKGNTEDGSEIYIYELENLSYKPPYYGETKRLLLFYNVLYYTSNMANHKFPFELYVKENWSIEHIIPQNPKNITDFEMYKLWYIDLLKYNDNHSYMDIITQFEQYDNLENLTKDKDFKAKLDKIVVEFEDTTHKINNLLLLDKNTNSSLGNMLFKDKRVKILRFDKNGKNDKGAPVFIPIETLNAFNKTFSKEINIENWMKEDGENYKQSIAERISDFLPKTT